MMADRYLWVFPGWPVSGQGEGLLDTPWRANVPSPARDPESTAASAFEKSAVDGNAATSAAKQQNLMSGPLDDETFEALVNAHYEALYRFALSLTHADADARDLVQGAFEQLAKKGEKLKDRSKAKSWLFTTLYRAFVDEHRREVRHPKVEMEDAEIELPVSVLDPGLRLDSETVQAALMKIDEVFRVPLILFYLEEHSYLEIAEILGVPPGTVMSRISRGRALLRRQFEERELVHEGKRGVVHE